MRLLFGGYQRAVAWHAHALVWGTTEAEIEDLKDDLNKRYEALLPGVDAVYSDLIPKHLAGGKTLYMLKAPQSEHRVYPLRREEIDTETGEITTPTTGRFKQRKDPLGPGDTAKMCKVLAGKYLHKLAFAAGEGRPLLDSIRREALEPLRRHEAREAARRAHRQGNTKRPPG